ncbi:MAG: tripartite tricarboxylate transporter TctB family protein [Alkalilacustris sp.]
MLRRAVDSAFMLFILGASVFLWLEADRFPRFPRMRFADSDFWPKIVFGLLIVLCAIYLIRTLLLSPFWREAARSPRESLPPLDMVMRFLAIAGLTLGYFAALQRLGFVPSTLVFLFVSSLLLPMGGLLVRALFAPIFTALLVVFFTRGLSLPLPRGSGMFFQFSLMLH